MIHLRNLITMSVLAGLVVISCAAAVRISRQGLPDLQSKAHSQLREQLTSLDLTQAPEETTLSLARHLEQELRLRIDWEAEIDTLDEQEWLHFQANVPVVMRAWFRAEVNDYFSFPPDERDEYLGDQIDGIMSWRAFDRFGSSKVTGAVSNRRLRALEGGLIENIRDWLIDASPDEQRRTREFLIALEPLIMERAAERIVPGGF